MKKTLLSILRNKHSTMEAFRLAAEQMGTLLAFEAARHLEKGEIFIETPLATTRGEYLKQEIVLIPILRAGVALLPSFLKLFPNSRVGFVGIRRDEETAHPHLFYQNLPHMDTKDKVIILDPMIATGGSGKLILEILRTMQIPDENILYVGIVAAPEGISILQRHAPAMKMIVAEIDEKLNSTKYIVPGLGDFGDRYFGT